MIEETAKEFESAFKPNEFSFIKINIGDLPACAAHYEVTAVPRHILIRAGFGFENYEGGDKEGLKRLVRSAVHSQTKSQDK